MGRKGGDNMKRFILMLIIALSATVQVFASGSNRVSGTATITLAKKTYIYNESMSVYIINHLSTSTDNDHTRDEVKGWARLEYSINGGDYKTYNGAPFASKFNGNGYNLEDACSVGSSGSDLWSNIMFSVNLKDLLSDDANNIKNVIQFRYIVYEYGYNECDGWNLGTCNAAHMHNTDYYPFTVTVYNLNPGEIAADTFSNPNVGRTDSPIYGIYGGNVSQNVYIGNKVSPSFVSSAENIYFSKGNQSFYNVAYQSASQDLSKYFSVSELLGNGQKFTPGTKINISRTVIYQPGNTEPRYTWTTDTLHYVVVQPVTIDSLRKSADTTYICNGDNVTIQLTGNYIQGDESINYGAQYGWQYNNGSGWKTLNVEGSTDEEAVQYRNTPDLEFTPKSVTGLFNTKEGYVKFRQIVQLNRFGHLHIYATPKSEANAYSTYYYYQKYAVPSTADFAIRPSSTHICSGETFAADKGNLKVVFTPKSGSVYSSIEGALKANTFKYKWEYSEKDEKGAFTGDYTTVEDAGAVTDSLHISKAMTKDMLYRVTVTDGCDNAVKYVTGGVTVDSVPSISKNDFEVGGASTVETNGDDTIHISAARKSYVTIEVKTLDKNCTYYMQKGEKVKALLQKGKNIILADSLYYYYDKYGVNGVTIYKKVTSTTSTTNCISSSVKVITNLVGVLQTDELTCKDNIDDKKTVYVCPNSASPEIKGEGAVSGGYSAIYRYQWQQSLTGTNVTWTNIAEATASNLPAGTLTINKDQTIYVRRIVFSDPANKGVGGVMSDTTGAVTIKPYSIPKVTVLAGTSESATSTATQSICYGTKVYLGSQIADSAEYMKQKNIQNQDFRVTYTLDDTIKIDSTIFGTIGNRDFDNTVIRSKEGITRYLKSTLSFCNTRVASSNKIVVTVGKDLTVQSDEIGSTSCKVAGRKVSVFVKNPSSGYDYAFANSQSEALPKDGTLTYKYSGIAQLGNVRSDYTLLVTKSNGECSQTTKLESYIPSGSLTDSIAPQALAISNVSAKGDTFLVCKGSEVTIREKNTSVNPSWSYGWEVNGAKLDTTTASLKYDFRKETEGKPVRLVRTTKYIVSGEVCDQRNDTVLAYIEPEASYKQDFISAEPDSICYGGSSEIRINPSRISGYQNTQYSFDNGQAGKVLTHTIENDSLTATHTVTISNGNCPENTLYQKQYGTDIFVAPNLTIGAGDVTVTPATIAKTDLQKGKQNYVVSVAVNGANQVLFYDKTGSIDNTITSPVTAKVSNTYDVTIEKIDSLTNNELFYVKKQYKMANGITCSSQNLYSGSVTITDGFTGALAITSDKGTLNNQDNIIYVKGACQGEAVKMRISQGNKITYNGAELDSSKVSYQWVKRNGASNWYSITNATSDSLTATPDKIGGDYYYACILYYKPDNANKANLISNLIYIEGHHQPEAGKVGEADSAKKDWREQCRGEETMTTLTYYGSSNCTGQSYIWQKKSSSASKWETVESDNGTYICNLKGLTETTYIRCLMLTTCGDTLPSKNVYTIHINGNSIDKGDIALGSESIISEGTTIKSLNFNSYDAKNTYHWTLGNQTATSKDGEATFSYSSTDKSVNASNYQAGAHSVTVYKVNDITGCHSDTISYAYRLFKELKVKGISSNANGILCNVDSSNVTIQAGEITGGNTDSTYTVSWYYSQDSSNYRPLTTEFSAKTASLAIPGIGDYYNLIVKNLGMTTYFKAVVSSPNYPKVVTTDAVSVKVYKPLEAGSIDYSESVICYGDRVDIKSITPATGGSGKYVYYWEKTENDGKSWERDSLLSGESRTAHSDAYAFTASAKYKRVVTDATCNTELATANFKPIVVLPEVRVSKEEIIAPLTVTKGRNAYIRVTDNSQNVKYINKYIWNANLQIDSIKGSEEGLNTKALSQATEFRISKEDSHGCRSVNADTITIGISEPLSGGTIVLTDDKFANREIIWLCSGDKAGQVESEYAATGTDLTYSWMYSKGETYTQGGQTFDSFYELYGASNKKVTTPSVNLDTCIIGFTSEKGSAIKYKLYRVTESGGIDVSSDTITITVAPTLASVQKYLLSGIAGTLTSDKTIYCVGEESQPIKLTVGSEELESWYKQSFGALPYGNDLITYWEIRNNKESKFHKREEYDYTNLIQYLSQYTISKDGVNKIDSTYIVRFTLSDGCSQVSTSPLTMAVRGVSNLTVDDFRIMNSQLQTAKGIEIGDAISVRNVTQTAGTYYGDAYLKDSLTSASYYLIDSVTSGTSVYFRPFDGNCYSPVVEIPIEVYPKSDAGVILRSQIVCNGDSYNGLTSGKEATGSTGTFSYQWQYSSNLASASSWKNIEGATSSELSEDALNGALINGMQKYYARRSATNAFGRTVYSDTITLSHYDEIKGGELSWADGSQVYAFCQDATLPSITTTAPTGGASGYYGLPYQYGWAISTDDTAYTAVGDISTSTSSTVNPIFALSMLKYDKSVNNTFYVRAIYKDNYCGMAYSKPLKFIIYRTAEAPSIYQEKDSCNARSVTVTVEDKTNYTYEWRVYNDNDSIVWTDPNTRGVTSKSLDRVTEYGAKSYGIVAYANPANGGCISSETRFTLDSLPVLSQDSVKSISKQCYGADFTISQSEAKGGSGSKHYQWQYSYDGKRYSDQNGATAASLTYKGIKTGTYFRRVVTDMCQSDTSNGIRVEVYDSVPLVGVTFADKRCPGQRFNAGISTVLLSTDSTVLGYETVLYDGATYKGTGSTVIAQTKLDKASNIVTMDGFDTQSKDYIEATRVKLSSGAVCYSRTATITAHNVSAIDQTRNIITTSQRTPCNGDAVTITGQSGIGEGADSSNISYSWYTSKDNKKWSQALLSEGASAIMTISDTMYVKRGISNGCGDTTYYSNTISFIGRPLEKLDYPVEMDLLVVTQETADSSSVNLQARTLDYLYYDLTGDGTVNKLKYGSNILPYSAETYKDSILNIRKNVGCVEAYRVTPISGGRISLDGSGEVCEGASLPSIMSTNVSGGKDSTYSYQWQYKNEHVSSYVDIEGATGKNYSPSAVDVKTSYRRVTTSDRYISYSNEVSVEIEKAPKLSRIVPDKDSVFFAKYGLSSSISSLQKTVNLSITLSDTIKGKASYAYYEEAEQGKWKRISDRIKCGDSITVIQLALTDSIKDGRIRVKAEYACGSDSSEEYTVSTLNVVPIYDSEMSVVSASCYGDTTKITLYDNSAHAVTGKYDYSMNLSNGKSYTFGAGQTQRIVMTESMSATITRSVKYTGGTDTVSVSSSRVIVLTIDTLKASFTYTLADGSEHKTSETDVIIGQGERIQFNNTSVGATSYYWQLLKPLNLTLTNMSLSETDGGKGLVSRLENPVCYFYNADNYIVTLKVTNAKGCSSTASNVAFILPSSAVKSYNTQSDARFVAEGADEKEYEYADIDVYPGKFSDELSIRGEGISYEYTMYDATGRKVAVGNGSGITTIATSNIEPGVYGVLVNGELFKVIKTK